MSSAGAGSSAKKSKTYHFLSEWEEDYFFTMNNSKCVCLICHVSPALAKKGNLERHFKSLHKKYDSNFPPKSELRKRKIRELKAQLSAQQALFTGATSKSKAATIASFRVSRVLSKHKKPFQDGEIFKEAFLEAAESLYENFKNKSEIMSAIKEVQLSRNTVMRRCEFMAEDLGEQLNKDIRECVFFSLQFDETTDMTDTSQLCIFIRMVFKDLSTKEELLKVLPLKGKTRGEDIFHTFSDFVNKTQLPVNKLVSVTTDGAPAMTGRTSGFVDLCRGDDRFPDFFNYHCVIHQQALCGKMLNMTEVMDISFKIVNSIRARSLQKRLFRSQLQENEAEHSDLLLYADVRWLSRGKFLQRFRDLLPEIKVFLDSKGRLSHHPHINNEEWLLDLAFLVDITGMLNELNLDLQGKDKTIVDMISAVTAFKQKLRLVSSQLQQHALRNFRNMKSELENQGKQCDQFNSGRYTEQVQNLASDFDRRFQDIAAMEPVATYMCFPFGKDTDVEDIASRMATLFNMDTSEVENEILKLQNDIQIKSMATGGSFWNLLSEKKYPNVRKCSMYLTAFFGSTYLCESTFSHLKYIKSKYRSTLSDEHLDACLKLAITNYSPNYTKLADSMQCHNLLINNEETLVSRSTAESANYSVTNPVESGHKNTPGRNLEGIGMKRSRNKEARTDLSSSGAECVTDSTPEVYIDVAEYSEDLRKRKHSEDDCKEFSSVGDGRKYFKSEDDIDEKIDISEEWMFVESNQEQDIMKGRSRGAHLNDVKQEPDFDGILLVKEEHD